MSRRRLAAIDAGTNTVLLCVAETDSTGIREILLEAERFARLGEGLDHSGHISSAATGRLLGILHEYRRMALDLGAHEILLAATSASRDAANGAEIAEIVRRETGIFYRIVSGDDEARLTFAGSVSSEPAGSERFLVFDIGGGSTEFMTGTSAARGFPKPEQVASIDIGSVRITERFFDGLPPAPEKIAAATDFINRELSKLPAETAGGEVLLGTSGSATTLAVLALDAPDWPAIADRKVVLSGDTVRLWSDQVKKLTVEEVLRLNPAVMTGRADVFLAGQLIVQAVMEKFAFDELHVTGRGLRHGLLLERVIRQNTSPGGGAVEHPK